MVIEAKPPEPPRIPIRNLWLLLVYAWDLAAFSGRFAATVEESPDLPHLIVALFAEVVDRRLRRSLTRQYVPRADVLTRVRGRIDVFQTTVHRTLERGAVACRYQNLSVDTPRNRLVRRALAVAATLDVRPDLRRRARALERCLDAAGVASGPVGLSDMRRETFARNDADDRLMVELGYLLLDLELPTQDRGRHTLPSPLRDDVLLRRIFERAVGRFYAYHLPAGQGWSVRTGERLAWLQCSATPEMAALMPRMVTDVVIERAGRRLVIDTKFTGILTCNAFGDERLKSVYLYQMYAYLRSQEQLRGAYQGAAGLLLHPALDVHLDESVTLDGHRIGFATVDLSADTATIERRLLQLVRLP